MTTDVLPGVLVDRPGPWPVGGETGALIRARDWSQTPLGAIQSWPQSLRTAVDIMLASPAPTSVMWGAELVQLYNDAYLPIAQERHPAIFGEPALENWSDATETLGGLLRGILAGGPAAVMHDQGIALRRADGRGTEQRVFRGTFSAIPDESGAVAGIFHSLQETTASVRAQEALRESNQRHRLIVEGARDYAILTTSDDGTIQSWSPGAEAVFGWSEAEAIGQDVAITFTPEDRARGGPERERAIARAEGSAPDVRWHQRKDGARVFIEGIARAVFEPGGVLRGFFKIGQDTTERRRIEDALREREAHLLAIFSKAAVGLSELTLDGRFIRVNDQLCGMLGRTRERLIGRSVTEVTHPDDVPATVARVQKVVETGTTAALDKRYLRPDGTVLWASSSVTRIDDEEGRARSLLAVTVDLTVRRRAETLLRDINQALEQRVAERTTELARTNSALVDEARQHAEAEEARREALRQLVAAEENERRRISLELHDRLGQQVTGILLGLRTLRGLDAPQQAPRLEELERLADQVARDLQSLALELRPPALDTLGLVAALQHHLEEWAERHGLAHDFHVRGLGEQRLPAEVETTLYRIVQEGLTNTLKHAGATQVSLLLAGRSGEVRAILEDDGAGFDVDRTLASPEKARRLGVRGMRERVALLGGELEIESSPGNGTTLFLRIPSLSTAADAEPGA